MFDFQLPPGSLPENGFLLFMWIALGSANFAMGVCWLILGWRAMKAHERLPEVLASRLGERPSGPGSGPESPVGP